MSSNPIKIIPYKNCELRAMYEMDDKPKKWKELMDLHKEAIGNRKGQWYDVNQVLIIFAKLGMPNKYLPDELDKKIDKINANKEKAA